MPETPQGMESGRLLSVNRIMVFAPHPDDDVLGCGGSLAKHLLQGSAITIVYLTSGEAGGLNSSQELKAIRIEEARQAASLLGIDDLIFMNLPDGGIDIKSEELDNVVKLLRQKRPHLVYLPHAHDLHRDHVKANELVLEACRRAAGPWHPQCGGEKWETSWILAYEIWSPLAHINYIEDITQFMELKIKALRQHHSQVSCIAYDEAIQGLNRYRGVTTGRGEYCECFQVVKAQM